MLTMPAALTAGVQSRTDRWDGRAAPRGGALLKSEMMTAHDRARVDYGANSLTWSDVLATDALAYARSLARSGRFEHDPQKSGRPRQGENLWIGTASAFSYADMARDWIDERRNFRPGRFPDIARKGDWSLVGHYTQIVWPATTRVGCAIAANDRDEVLVCRYFPAGNLVGTPMR